MITNDDNIKKKETEYMFGKAVDNVDITAKAKKTRAEYLREWRKKNKDKVKQYNRSYWERKAMNEEEEKGE